MEIENVKGTRDFLPEEKILQQKIVEAIKKAFELYGFNPIETPILEKLDILSSKYAGGSEILKETYKLKDQGNRDLGLRYDLTVPLARFIAMNPNLKMPFKRYEIGPVFRDGPIKLGRYRQFWQCDADVVGTSNLIADAELIYLALEVFSRFNLKTEVKVNNIKVLNSIMKYCGIDESKIQNCILAIDKLTKYGLEPVKKELKELKIKEDSVKKLIEIITIKGSNEEKINRLKKLNIDGIKEMEEFFSYVKEKEVVFEISLARGLSYYTGTIFEAFALDGNVKSSIASGGRYDKMISLFLNSEKEYPSVGISFGLDVLMDILKEKEKIKTNTLVYVIPINTLKECFKIVKDLRDLGINSDIDLIGRGISKNLDYANRLGIKYVLILGEKDLNNKEITFRDMITGEERKIKLNRLNENIKELIRT